jgi:hypothetical protein
MIWKLYGPMPTGTVLTPHSLTTTFGSGAGARYFSIPGFSVGRFGS